MKSLAVIFAGCLLVATCPNFGWSATELDARIQTLLKVDREGAGHDAAVPILQEISEQSAAALIPVLQGMDQANPLAANWLQGAFETIADRNLKAGSLPKNELEAFALDRSHAPQSRQLAFDWLVRVDPTATERLTPGMVDDPSGEFRRAGVQHLLDSAAKSHVEGDVAMSKELYGKAFSAARDPDQLDLAFDKLSEMGDKPDLKRQLGLLGSWWLIGPFDHRGGIGFNTAYPPETQIELDKTYPGTESEVAWVQKTTDERHSSMDLNNLIGRHKGAVAYAYQNFVSDRDQTVELRLGTPNGWKLWVNGQPMFAHEEYHQSARMDQYRTPVQFKAGNNAILLKICQNEQDQDWAQEWKFQIRVCDPTGTAVLPVATTQLRAVTALQK